MPKARQEFLALLDEVMAEETKNGNTLLKDAVRRLIKGKQVQGMTYVIDQRFGKPRDHEQDPTEGTAGGFSLPAELVAPSFLTVYRDIVARRHFEYVLYGGRGSTKSSFVSLVIIYLIKTYPELNAVALRQVADTMRGSVYAQLVWAIDVLGLRDSFNCTTSPLEITYLPTGQKIFFRGGDDPGKLKSLKPAVGYLAILWLEELDQFRGAEAVRNIEQSLIRGGDIAFEFKSFNPPKVINNWANKYIKIPKDNQLQHSSTYLDVPSEWLGGAFVNEAEFLKGANPKAYEHEYLGLANNQGGAVFDNITVRAITAKEIQEFDRLLQGIDWGYYPDPFAWNKMHFDAGRRTLYIFDEYRVLKAGNQQTYNHLVKEKGVKPTDELTADSAEPKSIGDYRAYGLACRAATKGPDSVEYSFKWLQSLAAIIIDDKRCPETADEFLSYEFERDKNGDIISGYPDKNDHHISAVRYGTNRIWQRRGE